MTLARVDKTYANVSDTLFKGNSCAGKGGAVSIEVVNQAKFENCTFISNRGAHVSCVHLWLRAWCGVCIRARARARTWPLHHDKCRETTRAGTHGGAMRLHGGGVATANEVINDVTVDRGCTFVDNRAQIGGAVIVEENVTALARLRTCSRLHAQRHALQASPRTHTHAHCTLHARACTPVHPQVRSATLTNNYAVKSGAALAAGAAAVLTIQDTYFAANGKLSCSGPLAPPLLTEARGRACMHAARTHDTPPPPPAASAPHAPLTAVVSPPPPPPRAPAACRRAVRCSSGTRTSAPRRVA